MSAPEGINPSERLARADLAGDAFRAGVDRGWWRLLDLMWPYAVIEVAPAPRAGSPDWFALRFDLSGYPEAPTAQPWDADVGAPLPAARWPGGNARILSVFNPGWRPDALYLPMDRVALQGHDAWLTQHACHVWDPGKDFTQYLRVVHELLNETGYTGVRG
jgi:hypothetical protein